MKMIFRTVLLLFVCVVSIEGGTSNPAQAAGPNEQRGPFLANATRNSWADQNSIVIWTRTTAQPEFVADGKLFVDVSSKAADKLSKRRDAQEIMSAQLPEGAVLNDMIGACPGMAGQVRLSWFAEGKSDQRESTDWKTTTAEQDFTAQWKLEGLASNTLYSTAVETRESATGDATATSEGSFRTAPGVQQTRDLTFCFTTCHDFIRRDDGMQGHKIYPSMTKLNPDFVVHAGDIEYYDKPRPWAMTRELMRFKWGRIFALPNYRQFYHSTSTYFIKDDHDTLKNDCSPGQMYGTVSFDEGVQIFNEEQFPSHPTRYKTVQWGKELQVWFLEGRDYRSSNRMPDGPDKTILGAEQKEWLFTTLKDSTATFKVICSPTPIVGPDRSGKKDNHANSIFEHEGQELRKRFSEIPNVIIVCGDRHWQYASVDAKTDLWEFGCGPGSDVHQFGWKVGDERPSQRFLRVKGGFLSGELQHVGATRKPKLTIRHHKTTGEQVSEFEFPVAK